MLSLDYEASDVVRSSLYRPIADLDEIRLIHLLPGSRKSSIECLIEHANLESKPQYEALSYMWGVPEGELPIKINNSTVRIRPNLKSALYHLRKTHRERVIWIDALCINQKDTNERNRQVNQMARIYSMASRVVLWLGESDNSSSRAMAYMGNFCKFAKGAQSKFAIAYSSDQISDDEGSDSESGKLPRRMFLLKKGATSKFVLKPLRPRAQSSVQKRLTTAATSQFSAPITEAESELTKEETITISKDIWDSIPALCFRPYWSRLWIVQEVVLATDVRIQCGNNHCNWNDFSLCVNTFVDGVTDQIGTGSGSMTTSEHRHAQLRDENTEYTVERPYPKVIYDLRSSTVHRLIRERDARKTTEANHTRPLLALTVDYKRSACEDPRDRIFGFHSFATTCCRVAVPVDYSLHISEISRRLVEHHELEHHLPDAVSQIRSFLEGA